MNFCIAGLSINLHDKLSDNCLLYYTVAC